MLGPSNVDRSVGSRPWIRLSSARNSNLQWPTELKRQWSPGVKVPGSHKDPALATTGLAGTQLSGLRFLFSSILHRRERQPRWVLDHPHPVSPHRCRDTRCISVSGQRFLSPAPWLQETLCLPAPSANGGSHSVAAWPAAGLLLSPLCNENVFYSPETNPHSFSHTNAFITHHLAEMFAFPGFPTEGGDGRAKLALAMHVFQWGFIILFFKEFSKNK